MKPSELLALVAGIGLLATAVDVGAQWRGSSGVSARMVWTDNLNLTRGNAESGSIVQLLPYVSFSRTGSRLNSGIDYGPSILFYPGNSELNDVQHVLSARASAEIVERYFFLDATAKANQALISPRRATGFDSLGGRDSFTQTASFSLRPRINLPIAAGRFATVRISPAVGAVYTGDSVSGARTRRPVSDTSVTVVSGPMFPTMPWRVSLRRRVWDADADEGVGRLSGTVGYIFSARYRLNGSIGYDDGDFIARNGRSSGVRWELGLVWTPRRTSSLNVGFGQAYFGEFGRLSASHRHRHWVVSSNYRVSVETATTEIAEQRIVELEDPFGNPITNPITGDVVRAAVTTPILVDDSFLRHRLNTVVSYSRARNTATWFWVLTQRDYSSADLDTLDNQWRFTFTRRLGPRLSASLGLRYWMHEESANDLFDYTQDAIDLDLRYTLGPRTTLTTRVARQNRDSERRRSDFSEHRVSLFIDFVL